MTLKDIISKYSVEQIVNNLYRLFPTEKKKNRVAYVEIVEKLQKREPVCNKEGMKLELEKGMDIEDKETWVDVRGRIANSEEGYGLEFQPWNEWLGMEIEYKTIKDYSELDIISHCLWEMTFVNFDEDKIKATIDELNKRVEDIKSGKEKTFPWEEVKERLLDKLDEK